MLRSVAGGKAFVEWLVLHAPVRTQGPTLCSSPNRQRTLRWSRLLGVLFEQLYGFSLCCFLTDSVMRQASRLE